MEGQSAILNCELTKANARLEWRKGNAVLQPNDKYKISQDGFNAELVIHNLAFQDGGQYSCMCGEQQTSATLVVNGKFIDHVHCTATYYYVCNYTSSIL